MILKCQCCGFEQEFVDLEAAFRAGWDAPPHFTGYIACNLCPAVCIVLGYAHHTAHDVWAVVGRPAEFGPSCYPDRDWGRNLDAELERMQNLFEKLRRLKT